MAGNMDLAQINLIVSLISGGMMLGAIVYILTYVLGSFSSRSGTQSPKVVVLSVAYFFGTTVPLVLGVEWLTEVARQRTVQGQPFYLNIGASALALNALLHVSCGFLAIFLYVRGYMSQGIKFRR